MIQQMAGYGRLIPDRILIRKFLVVILLIGLTAYYYAEALFFNNVLSFRDLSRYFYPLRFFTVSSMKSGAIPLWNPYIFCGTPHLALQQSVIFYPVSIIYYLISFDKAFNIFLILHIFLAGLFSYLLARRWGFQEAPSLLSAIIFMFSGYTVSVMNLATTLSSCIWLPMIIFFFDRALSGSSASDIFLSSLFLGTMFLGGEPSIFYSTLWVLLFYSTFFTAKEGAGKLSSIKKAATCYIATVAMGCLLASVQIMPFLELLKYADRASSLAVYEHLTKWSLPVKDTFNFLIPFFLRTDFSMASYWKEQNWVVLIYVGVFAPLLMSFSAVFKKEWRVKFLFFLGLVFLFVSYGNNTPFYYVVYRFVPGFRFIRYPVRFLYITTFSIAMLCGFGFDAYMKGRVTGDEKLHNLFKFLLVIFFIFSVLFLALHLYRNELIEIGRQFCVKHLDLEKEGGALFTYIAAITNTKRFLGLFVTGGMLLYMGLKFKIREGILNFGFIALVVADLFSVVPDCQFTLNDKLMRSTTSNIEYLKKDRFVFRFFGSPKTRESSNFLNAKSYEEANQIAKDKLSSNWPVIYGLYDASGYDSIRLKDYAKLMNIVDTSNSPSNTRILDMLNVKYLVNIATMDAEGYKLVNEGEAYLYENTNVLPRAFLAGSYKVLVNELDIANRFKSKDFDPAKEVVLEEEPCLQTKLPLPVWKFHSRGGNGEIGVKSGEEKVEITKYLPNEVIVKAAVNSPKFLVLSDSYYPGWKAYVDGKLDKIYKANFILRAVYLTSGAHTIRFAFDPFSFKLGLTMSLATLFFCIFYIVYRKI